MKEQRQKTIVKLTNKNPHSEPNKNLNQRIRQHSAAYQVKPIYTQQIKSTNNNRSPKSYGHKLRRKGKTDKTNKIVNKTIIEIQATRPNIKYLRWIP